MNTRYQKWLVITWVIILVESVALIFVSGGDSILTASVEDIHNQTAVEVTSKQTNIQENTTPTQDNAQG